MLQIRPMNDPNAPGYNPHRDIAYFYPELVRVVVGKLRDEANWAPWYGEYLRETGTSAEDLSKACYTMAVALRRVAEDPDVESPQQAMEEAGWYEVSRPAQLVLCAVMGQVCFGGFFVGIRDTTILNERSPIAPTLERLLELAEEHARKFTPGGLHGEAAHGS